jgi:glutaminyl-tRNA synthetase
LYIEREDFMEDPPKKFFRLAPGREVRLRAACLITCEDMIKDDDGQITEVHCRWDPESRGGSSPDGRKVKGTLHWVSARHAVPCEVRLYDRLFQVESPDGDKQVDFREHLNPDSLQVVQGLVEPSAADAAPGTSFQFERLGYFVTDLRDSKPGSLVFNRTIGLRDNWAKRSGS